MSDTSVNPTAVIDDLAEQVKRLTVENSVLRAGIAQLQSVIQQQNATAVEVAGKDAEGE